MPDASSVLLPLFVLYAQLALQEISVIHAHKAIQLQHVMFVILAITLHHLNVVLALQLGLTALNVPMPLPALFVLLDLLGLFVIAVPQDIQEIFAIVV
jgi:hypothetical protein